MDRRKMLALLGTSPALLTGSAVHAESPKVAGENASRVIGGDPITVLNPAIAGKLAERVPLTERLKSLDGKTIYLIDIQWGGPDAGYDLLQCMQEWFAKNMPTVKTVLRRTSGNMFTDDPGLRKELIEKHADAAIVGVAG